MLRAGGAVTWLSLHHSGGGEYWPRLHKTLAEAMSYGGDDEFIEPAVFLERADSDEPLPICAFTVVQLAPEALK